MPDLAWQLPPHLKRAFLQGAWQGDGSWSLVDGGPSVVLEHGTVSPELAEGLVRLLGDLDIVARRKVGRSAKSTVDAHFITISGAEQVERDAAALRHDPEQHDPDDRHDEEDGEKDQERQAQEIRRAIGRARRHRFSRPCRE